MAISAKGIAQDIHHDVLSQIFVLCLPSDPLNHAQPDVTQAPMLLCQICSHWRYVALTTPTIWKKLCSVSHIIIDKGPHGVIHASDVIFLHWWVQNVGRQAPFLRLSLKSDMSILDSFENLEFQLNHIDEVDDPMFLVKFLSSAQYLDLDHFYSIALRKSMGDHPLLCSNLDTLLMRQGIKRNGRHTFYRLKLDEEYDTHMLIPVKVTQPIRRLFIQDILFSVAEINEVMLWSHMTHICVSKIYITIDMWFLLIRECRELVCGEFSITNRTEHDLVSLPSPPPPVPMTLPRLRQFVLLTYGHGIYKCVFQNLRLPSLTALRIDHYPSLSIDSLHRILESTPALKELHLGPDHPRDSSWNDLSSSIAVHTVTPLSAVVPDLEFISFGGRGPMDFQSKRKMICTVLRSPWLDLGGSRNRISQVEFEYSQEDGGVEELMSDLWPEAPNGVKVSLRAVDAPNDEFWNVRGSDGLSLVGCFEDLKFREII